jgi:hypothetical protein
MDGEKKFYTLRDRNRLYVLESTPDEVQALIERGQELLGPPCDSREEAEVIIAIFHP